ncbi:MAG: peptidoglycan-binding protein [Anaerolineales bacterium]|nr:peptidoglycan-binding protein [Anaerolineales bacterium]
MSFLSKITDLFSKKPKNQFQEEIEANIISAKQNGWAPGWFGQSQFDDGLINQIKRFQRQYFIEENGIVGPLTFRRLITERESLGIMPFKQISYKGSGYNPAIIKSGKRLAINWDKVINFEDNPSWAAPAKSYRPWTSGQRKNDLFVVHWDAALSSRSCLNILQKRNLSVHF